MLEVPYLPPALPNGDRSGRFIATGVILILIALMSGCMTAAIPFSVVMLRKTAQQMAYQASQSGGHVTSTLPPQFANPEIMPLVAAGVMYLAFTVAAGWLGVAALLKRRYVRPLVMIFSTHGLILGVLSVAAFAVVIPMQWQQLNRGNAMMPGAAMVGMILGAVIMLVLMIGLPLALLLMMKPEAVRETAEHYDLQRRWTDGLPVKVLGLVLTLAVFVLFDAVALARPRLPLIVTVLSGAPAILFLLTHAGLMAAATRLVYQRKMLGWHLALWGMTVPVALFLANALLLPSDQFLTLVNTDPNTLDLARENEMSFRIMWTITSIGFLIATLVYLRQMKPLIDPPVAAIASE